MPHSSLKSCVEPTESCTAEHGLIRGTSSCTLLGRFLHSPVDAQERVGGLGHTVTTGYPVWDSGGGRMRMCPGQCPCSRMVGNMVNKIVGNRLDEEKREQPPDTP